MKIWPLVGSRCLVGGGVITFLRVEYEETSQKDCTDRHSGARSVSIDYTVRNLLEGQLIAAKPKMSTQT